MYLLIYLFIYLNIIYSYLYMTTLNSRNRLIRKTIETSNTTRNFKVIQKK